MPEPIPGSGPVRTCIGCRARAPRSALLRLVHDAADGLIRVDGQKSAAGRGAHLHDDADCFALAVRRRAIGRALHRTGEVVLSAELLARFEPAADPTSVDAGDSAATDPTSIED